MNCSTLSLSGKNKINFLSLKGKFSSFGEEESPVQKKNKIQIMNLFIIPIINSQWQIVAQNMFILEKLKRNISYFKKIVSPTPDEIKKHKEYLKLNLKKNFY